MHTHQHTLSFLLAVFIIKRNFKSVASSPQCTQTTTCLPVSIRLSLSISRLLSSGHLPARDSGWLGFGLSFRGAGQVCSRRCKHFRRQAGRCRKVIRKASLRKKAFISFDPRKRLSNCNSESLQCSKACARGQNEYMFVGVGMDRTRGCFDAIHEGLPAPSSLVLDLRPARESF